MADILTVTRGLPSVLYQSVELARRLAVAGHHVTFAGDAEARPLVEHLDLGFLALEPSRYEAFLQADARAPTLKRLRDLRRRRDHARESLAVDGFTRHLQIHRPDLVLVNGEMHEHVFAASAAGSRVALLNSFVSIWRAPGLPPPHTVARRGVGWTGTRAWISLLWLALRARKARRACGERVRAVGCDRVSVLRELARALGLDLDRETDASQWLIPFTHRHHAVLTLHALEFEFPHRPPGHVHYVGPMVLERRLDRPLPAEEQARLHTLLARRRDPGHDRTLIYAGFGSVLSTDPAFLRRLAGIVAERPGWDLVISLSGRLSAADLGPMPPGVHAFDWVPQLQVLAHADVAVTHGGVTTTDECVLNGVPSLVYCGWQTDMAGTTARILHHGLGLAGDRRRDTTADIRSHVEHLVREPGFRERVRRLRAAYAAYADRRVAETVVEALLARPVTHDRSLTRGVDDQPEVRR
jgi:UDP:flavonoid glycosyltransferase YjiC (YdhE family)